MNKSTTAIHCQSQALAIVAAALATGIFYQEDLKDACNAQWAEAFPVVGHCITANEGRNWVDEPNEFSEKRALRERLRAELQMLPRGSWALIRRPWKDEDRVSWSAFSTGGDGRVSEPQTSHLPGEPCHEDMVRAMVGMEIYETRCELKLQQNLENSRKALTDNGWRTGMTIKNIRLGTTNYSSAKVTEANPATGIISLLLTRMGSPNRWQWSGLAAAIELHG